MQGLGGSLTRKEAAQFSQTQQPSNGLPSDLLFIARQNATLGAQQPENPTLNTFKELVNTIITAGVRKNAVLSVSIPEQSQDVVFSFFQSKMITIKLEVFKILGLTSEECCQLDKIDVFPDRVIFSKRSDIQAKVISITFLQPSNSGVIESVYTGPLKEYKEHGFGKCISNNGIIYTGAWSAGKLHGVGVYTDEFSCYVGGWQSNEMHGLGVHMKANGVMYDGNWRRGKLSGIAAVGCSNGGFRCNEWVNGFLQCDNPGFDGVVVNHNGSEFYSASSREGQAMWILPVKPDNKIARDIKLVC